MRPSATSVCGLKILEYRGDCKSPGCCWCVGVGVGEKDRGHEAGRCIEGGRRVMWGGGALVHVCCVVLTYVSICQHTYAESLFVVEELFVAIGRIFFPFFFNSVWLRQALMCLA